MIERRGGEALLFGSVLCLAACTHAPQRPNPPPPPRSAPAPTVVPHAAPDLSQIPDAVPRAEPRSPFGNPPFYDVAGHRYVVLASASGYVERGVASWYGTEFHGLRTSTGEAYDMFAMTAAHKTLPLPCYARVTNLENGKSIVVRINDRGPFVANRIIDLSYSAALKLEMIRKGTAFVQVEVLTPAAAPLTASAPVNVPAVAAASVGVDTAPPVSAPVAVASGADLAHATSAGADNTAGSTPAPAAADSSALAAAPAPQATGGANASAGSAPTASAAPAVSAGTLYIQVGAYGNPDNARRTAQKLRAAGLQPLLSAAPDARAPLQRVRVGPVASVEQFDALMGRLAALGFPQARLAQD